MDAAALTYRLGHGQFPPIMNGPTRDPRSRFSDRVENYVRYRPGYPPEVMTFLETRCLLNRQTRVADVGSGTGILTELLLRRGLTVDAVEPNPDMRAAAQKSLGNHADFHSHDGSAEATGLGTASVALIVAGQAFHWFDRARAKAEFPRILSPGGHVALIWNERDTDSTPFLQSYESLLHGLRTDYPEVNHMNIADEVIAGFFAPGSFDSVDFPNSQLFDLAGFKGRCLSSSYVPNVGQPGHDELLAALESIFATHQSDGLVEFRYTTRVHLGKFG